MVALLSICLVVIFTPDFTRSSIHVDLRDYQEVEEIVKQYIAEVDDASAIHVMVHSKVRPDIVDVILARYSEVPLILGAAPELNTLRCFNETCSRIPNIVGIFSDPSEVHPRQWRAAHAVDAWNSRSKIAIWITGFTSPNAAQAILEMFWSIDCLKVVVLTMNGMSNLTVYSYDPFWIPDGSLTERRSYGKMYEVKPPEKLYVDKLKDLRGYPVKTVLYDTFSFFFLTRLSNLTTSSDVTILRFLSSWLNFTIELISSSSLHPGVLQSDSTLSAEYTEAMLLGNSQLLEVAVGKQMEFIQPYARTFSRVVVPAPGLIPGIIRIFRSLDILTFVLLFSLSWILVMYFFVAGNDAPILNTFRLLIHQQFHQVSHRLSEKIFAISWILFAYIFISLQQSHLIKDMTDPPYYRGIDTLQELAVSNLTILASPLQYLTLKHSHSAIKQQLAERMQVEVNTSRCMEQLMQGEELACITDAAIVSTRIWFRPRRPTARKYRPRFRTHMMRSFLGDHWRAMLVRKNCPYLEKFDEGLRRMMQAGFVEMWMSKDFGSKHANFVHQDNTRALNLVHFEGPLKIFLLGAVISIIVFTLELTCFHLKSKFTPTLQIFQVNHDK